ncbi:MAG: winged helix DNA-binding domain-containing protein [Verrucomicrobia bacterium]|nr:winged helix DNA-binding domain-containing protein [Verrucomicrobiota bacterium]MBV8483803.1 winged helix DNA-binding domain-containing protein [Verrucomicrobiota bacterium]
MLEEWAPRDRMLDRDAALAELTSRYFAGHGPATLQDFVWWSVSEVTDRFGRITIMKPCF